MTGGRTPDGDGRIVEATSRARPFLFPARASHSCALWLIATVLMLAGMQLAGADDAVGAWSGVFDWPLIAIHTVLTPDARVMSYGTDQKGMATGYFVYDLWDPSGGPTGSGHVTLPNTTNTDLFCSSQLVLPTGGNIFVAGGDTFVDGHVTHVGNS